jgi:hypothetical protein
MHTLPAGPMPLPGQSAAIAAAADTLAAPAADHWLTLADIGSALSWAADADSAPRVRAITGNRANVLPASRPGP